MKPEQRFPVTLLLIGLMLILAVSFAFFVNAETVLPPASERSTSTDDGDNEAGTDSLVTSKPTVTPTVEPTQAATLEPTATSTPIPSPTEAAPVINPNPSDPMEVGPFPRAQSLPGDGETVSILAAGDVLFHSHLINGGLAEDGSYNYDYAFKHLSHLTADADLAIVNMEGTLAGAPYSGFPLFSAPDAVASAIRSAGFDMATTANNHMIDKGTGGLIRTVDVLEDKGLIVSGTRRSLDEPFYDLLDIGGIRIAVATFTYETIRQEGRRALNALVILPDAEGLINSFSMEEPYMSADFERMGRLAQTMRSNGADAVIFNIHWGTEYSTSENWYQTSLAQKLADNGVDLIIGNGPHVIQPIKQVQASNSDHRTIVYYSVGNLLSDQLYSTADSNGLAEDGLIAQISFGRLPEGKIGITEVSYIETYCHKVKTGPSSTLNTIVPIRLALANPSAYDMEGAEDLLSASLARTESIMAGNVLEGFENR